MQVADAETPAGAEAAAAYFLAAKKRIGLLDASLLDIHCLFFASIYEKLAFRALPSWYYLQQAATRLRVYHLRRGGALLGVYDTSAAPDEHELLPNQHQPEERIFWAIFKAERFITHPSLEPILSSLLTKSLQ